MESDGIGRKKRQKLPSPKPKEKPNRSHTMNTKHTPGPWFWDDKDALPWTDYDKTDHMPYLIDANGRIVMSGEDIRINNAANASLINAAPDLLEALKAMVSAYAGQVQNDGSYAVIDVSARAAIAKAEGKA